jgi:phosphopantothenoylcysteine decarboxylase/phosphopantothenate--cysteine ligase
MNNLKDKKILLAVSGSIAAYKAAFLTRLFVKAGAEVKVLMTPAGTDFISPLTLSTLSGHPVHSSVSSGEGWNNHVEMGLWADAMVVAPATANTLAKMATGICDNAVLAVYLSARCPVFFAPAMDLDMWQHPTTQTNVERLISFGNHMIPVGYGELASGLTGEGRMAEPEDIAVFLDKFFGQKHQLAGKKILITAGPTYEKIDPVRFIGNYSSGKMGIALANEAAANGAKVILVLGPTHLSTAHPGVEVIRVSTAIEMRNAAREHFPNCDAAILAAAVADYRPKNYAEQKIKKNDQDFTIQLVENPDIAKELGQKKKAGQVLVGFALETQSEVANAKAKIKKKNFDCIVLNSLNDKGAGFGHDTNKISIIGKDNKIKNFELKSKTEVAGDIIDELAERLGSV